MRLRALSAPLAGCLLALALLAPTAALGQDTVTEDPPVTSFEATAAADKTADVIKEQKRNDGLTSSAGIVDGHWEVAYFNEDDEVALVLVDQYSGAVLESWTGYQVAWKMARGYSGAFGHKLNAPYVFIPLCAIFLLGLVDWRRIRRIANLDLVVLLSFAISHIFFNRGDIGVSVPLQYPPLVYLLCRCIWIGVKGRGEGIRPVWPVAWLVIASLFLLGFRGGLNAADSGVIDVGYASVVGADRIVDGEQIYGNFPDDVSSGDTYGPVNYMAYIPFEQITPWSGSWDDLPAGHAAAVTFDIAVFVLLLLLGRRLRPGEEGNRLAATLGFGWAAFPYAAYTLESNSNDSLVALFLVAVMLSLARPVGRGILAALATFTKFIPGILVPLFATYEAPVRSKKFVFFALAFGTTTFAVLAQTIFGVGLHEMYERTVVYQNDRDSPFSIWGQVHALEPLRYAILAATMLGSVLLAFRPRYKSPTQVAAFAAALLIGLQLTAEHWFYLYIVWFYPLALVGFAAISPEPEPSRARSKEPSRPGRPRRRLPSPRRPRRRSRNEPASA